MADCSRLLWFEANARGRFFIVAILEQKIVGCIFSHYLFNHFPAFHKEASLSVEELRRYFHFCLGLVMVDNLTCFSE